MEPDLTELETIDALKKLPLTSRDYVKLVDRYLAPYQLNSSLYYYLIKLHAYGDLPQETLVQLTHLNASNVTRAVKKLLDLHYLTKKENPADRRAYLLSLTADGEKMYPIIKQCLQKVNEEFLSPLSAPEQKQFIALVNRLSQ